MAAQRPSVEERLSDAEGMTRELDSLDVAIAELKAHFEQYFLGVDRQPPTKDHESVRQRLGRLRIVFVRSAALKFRVQALQQRFTTYDRLWQRTLTEMENGTYSRDLFKARRRRKTGDVPAAPAPSPAAPEAKAQSGASPAPAAPVAEAPPPELPRPPVPPAAPVAIPTGTQGAARPGPVPSVAPVTVPTGTQGGAARPKGVPAGTQGGAPRPPAPIPAGTQGAVARAAAAALAEPRLRAVYDAYLAAKKRCKEDVSRLSFESVADSLRKQVPELLERHGARDVEYKVVVKDGKAVLRAVPKG